MIPFFAIVAVLGFAGFLVKVGTDNARTTTSAGRSLPPSREKACKTPHIVALIKMGKLGKEPPEWLINEAMREAYEEGNYRLMHELHRLFGATELDTPIPDDEKETPDTMTVSGKSSPLDGVSNEAWEDFVTRLSTDDEKFSTDRHVGRFHHSRDRLKQLGIESVETADQQYEALVRDLEDARSQSQDLITQYLATEVEIMSQTYPVTLSGILGLLKCAGVKNAKAWLDSASDRNDHPQTTKIFLATNGVF